MTAGIVLDLSRATCGFPGVIRRIIQPERDDLERAYGDGQLARALFGLRRGFFQQVRGLPAARRPVIGR